MENKDLMNSKGSVHIRIYRKDTSQVVKEFSEDNLIVKTGRQTIVKMLANKATSHIKSIGVGKGGAKLEGGVSTPIPPKADDTGLNDKVSSVDIIDTTLDLTSARPSVTFSANIDSVDIDSDINELGLFFDDGVTMFSKKTFRSIPFDIDSNLAMDIDWKVVF